MRRIVEFLRIETAPYLLTLFFAALGWALTRGIDRVAVAPIIEYRIRILSARPQSHIWVDIENLTRSTTFRDLEFQLRTPDYKDITSPKIQAHEPAAEGPKPRATGASATFEIPVLHPGWRFSLSAMYRGAARPNLYMTSSAAPVQLVMPSFLTFFVRYEQWLIGGLLGLWAAAMLPTLLVKRGKIVEGPGGGSSRRDTEDSKKPKANPLAKNGAPKPK